MDVSTELMAITPENITLTDGSIYEHIYLDVNQGPHISSPEQAVQFDHSTDGGLNIIYEREIPLTKEHVVYSLKEVNVNATEDESMAVEALRQLGNSAICMKNSNSLSLLTCWNCDLQFQTTADFQNHLATCTHSQFKCYVCSEVFDKSIDFNNHIVCHAVQRPHSCRICSSLFAYERDLMEHLQTHELLNTNQCKVCGNVFQRPSSLANHMKIHNYQPGRAILNVGSSIKPQNDSDVKDITSLSNLNISNWDDYELIKNEDFHTGVNLDVGQEMTITSFEEEKSNIDYGYINDESTGYQEEEITTTKLIQNDNVREDENKRPYICKYCNKAFAREKALNSHYKLHSNVLQTYHQCKDCDEYLTDDESLAKHSLNCDKKLKQVEINDLKIQNDNPPPPVHPIGNDCVTLMENAKIKSYKHPCTSCGKRFSTKQKLHRHQWIHRKKMFSCEICALSFEKQKELDSHRLSTHQKNSAYVCNECGKCFSSRQGLWEHNRIHGDPTQLYKCTECSKTFSSRQGFLIHRRAHNDERPYGCRFCWKSFRDGGTLRKHERIHTGERPHACPLCSRAFNQKVVLREHVRWLHTANQEPAKSGMYDCTLCEYKFTDKDDLCAHIVKHSDQLALLAKDASKRNINNKSNSNNLNTKSNNKKTKIEDKVVIEIISPVNALNLNFSDIKKPMCECDLCGDKFLNENDLSEHVRIHI